MEKSWFAARAIIAISVLVAVLGCSSERGTGSRGEPGQTSAALDWNRAAGARAQATLASGWYHGCALAADGSVTCWGRNDQGQVGDGTTITRLLPAVVAVPPAVSLGAGWLHTCAVVANGAVYCWGYNAYGQLGDGTALNRATPVPVVGLPPAVAVVAGMTHTCALTTSGTVYCWGHNSNGQLGNGSHTDTSTPVPVANMSQAIALTANYLHTCAIRNGGTVSCWGYNGRGQLGNGTTTDSPYLTNVSGLTGATAVAAGGLHTCALGANRVVSCWGAGDNGQLGAGGTADHLVPVSTGVLAVSLTSGFYHACAARADATALCWGYGGYGQLGNGSTATALSPVLVSGMTTATVVTAGALHSCAIEANGAVACWGNGADGELGNGTNANATAPTIARTPGPTPRGPSISGGFWTTCALEADGSARCWGLNTGGGLGTGSTTPSQSATPLRVYGSQPFVAVSAGGLFACGITVGGGVECWGDNMQGELGTGTTAASSAVPIPIPGLGNVVSISGGYQYACAVTVAGMVYCWGNNAGGQLGDGTLTSRASVAPVVGVWDAIAVSANYDLLAGSTCALLSSRAVACWGNNSSGELGDGTTTSHYTAAPVAYVTDAVQISVGTDHACILHEYGGVGCWGRNAEGELGTGTTTASTTITQPNLSGVVAMAAGNDYTCGVRYDGSVYCWGFNHYGQLGVGYTSPSALTPTLIAPLAGGGSVVATAVATAGYHTCATGIGGGAYCWGMDNSGETGTTPIGIYPVPHAVAGFP